MTKEIVVTRDLAIQFAIQAMRQDEDPEALQKEFDQLFVDYPIEPDERERVERELKRIMVKTLMDLRMIYRASLALSNIHVTRELRLPGE